MKDTVRFNTVIQDPETELEYDVTLCATIGNGGIGNFEMWGHKLTDDRPEILEIIVEGNCPAEIEAMVLQKIDEHDYDAEIWEKAQDQNNDVPEEEHNEGEKEHGFHDNKE